VGRVIIDKDTMNKMIIEKRLEEKNKDKVKGSPVDAMLSLDNEDSILSKYIKRKKEEYDLYMENFDDDFEEKLNGKYKKKNITDSYEEDYIISGGSENVEFSEDLDKSKVIPFQPKRDLNINNIIDDLL
jgi:hypothetical protein